jgi:predicted transcriptional regulator
LSRAAQIVSAHVANNAVAPDDLSKLIGEVHRARSRAGQADVAPVKGEPAIPVKRSDTAAHITCLECGKQFSMLKRHLMTDHNLTPERYRQKWDLPPSYPVVAPDYDAVGAGRL